MRAENRWDRNAEQRGNVRLRFESLEGRCVLSAAPTTTGLDAVQVNEDAADEVISLWETFDDAEDADADLTLTIQSNTNAALFSALDIDDSTGQLTLAFAADAWGDAELVIRATDTDGLYVDTVLQVTVTAVNDAPVISDFTLVRYGDWITVSGTVSDVDDVVDGWTVSIGGDVSAYATIEPDGTFSTQVEAPWDGTVFVSAITEDPTGESSNLAGGYA